MADFRAPKTRAPSSFGMGGLCRIAARPISLFKVVALCGVCFPGKLMGHTGHCAPEEMRCFWSITQLTTAYIILSSAS